MAKASKFSGGRLRLDGDMSTANRPYWTSLRIIATFASCAIVAVLGWKFLTSSISINIVGFSFSELLSLILAVFSIALSLVFYLKASETSNTFYDNTYKFTASVSEILGRIEAGFSERLRHLDEGYSRLGERFDRIPFSFAETTQQIAREEEIVGKKQKERDKLIDELLAKARLEEGEKAEYLEQLRNREAELAQARDEVSFLRNKLKEAEEAENADEEFEEIIVRTLRRIARRLEREQTEMSEETVSRLLHVELQKQPSRILGNLIRFLRSRNLIDPNMRLTQPGMQLMRSVKPQADGISIPDARH